MDVPDTDFTLAGTIDEVKAKGRTVCAVVAPRRLL
jgi:hypothetical protein